MVEVDLLKQFDPHKVHAPSMSVFDVASTIFPSQSRTWRFPVDRFSKHYIRVYERLKRRSSPGWGFYFQRLVCFGPQKLNQLEIITTGLKNWGRNHSGAFIVHLSSMERERPRPQGGPCWQYGQFMADGGKLHLTVAYRSHDYFNKALGNFVGLSRLLTYVCSKTGHTVGTLTCMSTYAFLGPHRGKTSRLLSGS